MKTDINFLMNYATGICQLAETMLAKDSKQGVAALSHAIDELYALTTFLHDNAFLHLRRLKVLHRALIRARSSMSRDIIARKAVMTMWESLFSIHAALRREKLVDPQFTQRKTMKGFFYALLIFLVIFAGYEFRSWMMLDAASDVAYDFLQGNPPGFTSVGMHGLEQDKLLKWRWIEGPSTCTTFSMPRSRNARLHFAAMNLIPQQQLSIYLNGVAVASFENIPTQPWGNIAVQGDVELALAKDRNILCFECRDYNHNGFTFAPADSTPYSLAFMELTLTTQP